MRPIDHKLTYPLRYTPATITPPFQFPPQFILLPPPLKKNSKLKRLEAPPHDFITLSHTYKFLALCGGSPTATTKQWIFYLFGATTIFGLVALRDFEGFITQLDNPQIYLFGGGSILDIT